MTKHLLRAGRFGNASTPPAHFLVSFHNNGGNTHNPTTDDYTQQNEVYYGAFPDSQPNYSSYAYLPTGGTGSFALASVSHSHSQGSFGGVSGDGFGVFQINGQLHVGLYSWGPNSSTDATGDIEYACRVKELV